MAEFRKTKVGALWQNTSQRGLPYLSGKIEVGGQKVELIVFENKDKKKENQPDYTIYQQHINFHVPLANFKINTDAMSNKMYAVSSKTEHDDSDDIPF